jgi:hypothetical protein
MSRGLFNFIISHEIYAKAPKSWYVSLVQCDCFWFDLVVNPPIEIAEPEPIKQYLKNLKKRVEDSLEKRFIYMYGSRKKMRFDTHKPLSLSFFFGRVFANFLVGAQGKRQRIRCDLSPLGIFDPQNCKFFATDKFLKVSQDGKNWVQTSVHDFLQICAVEDIGQSTKIHYVGLTKNPHTRPLGREHRGYGDMVYGVGSDDKDFFLYVAVFKVMTNAINAERGMHFVVPNSMTNEIVTQQEGLLIEDALIAYFDSEFQDEKGARERAEFKTLLRNIKRERSIESLVIDFEVEGESPYYRLGSSKRNAQHRHIFRCTLADDQLSIEQLPDSFEAHTLFK